MAEKRDPGWYITTAWFNCGGEVFNNLGPFPNKDLALKVRRYVERAPQHLRDRRTFAVDEIRAQVTADV